MNKKKTTYNQASAFMPSKSWSRRRCRAVGAHTKKRTMTQKKILIINGWFLVIVGFIQAIMTMIGRFTGKGILKQLHEEPLGAIGMFEGFMLAGLFGIVFIRTAKKTDKFRFWNLLACFIHLTLGTANIVFWMDTFVAIDAQIPGTIATVLHFAFALTEGLVGLKKAKE